MIWSRYNEFIQDQDGFFLFNCRTQKWLTLVQELYQCVADNKDNPDEIEQIHPTLYTTLIENDFLVPNIEYELSKCFSEIEKQLESSNFLKLTINPTLDCNLRCWYCYEDHLKGSEMTASTIATVCKYIDRTFKENDYKRLQLSFFGGEPLLKYRTVVNPLLKNIKQLCESHDVEFAVSFTTNGVFLTKKIIDEIKNIIPNVSFQIPFDGDSSLHNQVKKFPNGKGSYEIVKQNAREAVLSGCWVSVRCNFTKENVPSFQNVIEDFKDLLDKPNLRFSFHKVWQETESDELKNGIKKLKENVAEYTFSSNLDSYFGNSMNPCYGDYADNYVINYNGDVFKCTARDFTSQNRIGILTDDGEILFNTRALQRVSKRWTFECPSCRRLPICPICSQVKSESADGNCPVKISPEAISQNIRDYFMDLYRKNKQKQ